MTSTTGDPVQIFYTGGKNNFRFSEEYSIIAQDKPGDHEKTITFRSRNAIIRTLRIDPGKSPGEYSVSNITFSSYFGPPVTITPQDESLYIRTDSESKLISDSKSWKIRATGTDPYMILSGNFKTYNFYINYLLPAIFALALFLFSPKFKIFFDNSNSNLPFLNDVGAKKPSSGENFAALDGVRGLAALLVLGDHVGCPGLDGAGAVGVVVFFCLSGYLLSMSFAKSPSKISQVEYVKNYFSRRLMRILPMFYFICIVGYLFKGELGDFLRTVLFVQANGILWTVLQEIYFYLFLPFIIALNFYLFRGRLVMCVFFLLAITIAFNNGYIPTFQIFGNGTKMPLYIGVFLSGMVMCYVFHIPFVRESKVIKQIADNPLISIFCLFLLFSTQNLHHFLPSIPSNPIWLYRSNYCLLIGIILLFVTLSKDSILSRCLSIYPLRAIGIVGFSFYLLHPFIYQFYKTLTQQYLGVQHSGIGRFGLVLALTYLASTITYTYIERPFLKKTR